MKIAICLSGHTRTYKETCQSIFEEIVNKNKQHQFEFFIHTYNATGNKITPHGNASNEDEIMEAKQIVEVIETYKPVYIMVEDNSEVIQKSKPEKYLNKMNVMPETNVKAVLSMYYSIKKANQLKQKYENKNKMKFDAKIRARFDDLIEKFDFKIEEVKEKYIYVPTIDGLQYNAKDNQDMLGWSWRGGLNDQLGIGTSKTMNIYAETYDNIEKMFNKGTAFHPETMLRKQIIDNNIEPKLVDEIRFKLHR